MGLITFGTHVHVHELGFSECSKCFVFRGSKEYTSAQVCGQGVCCQGLGREREGCQAAMAPTAATAAQQFGGICEDKHVYSHLMVAADP